MRGEGCRSGLTLLELLVVLAILGTLIGLLLPAVMRIRDTSSRMECGNRLRQIGLALHQYHGSYNAFPPGMASNAPWADYPYLGWQARILPFIEQEALWRLTVQAYQLDPIPFDNPPHVVFDTVVRLYTCPSDSRTLEARITLYGFRAAFTSYLGVEGANMFSEDGMLYHNSRVRIADVTDGTSQTLFVGERPPSADLYYGWWYAGGGQRATGSCDMILGVREINFSISDCQVGPYHYKHGRLSNQCDQFHFWSLHFSGVSFLFADGSLHFIDYSSDPLLPALATRGGGEPADLLE